MAKAKTKEAVKEKQIDDILNICLEKSSRNQK